MWTRSAPLPGRSPPQPPARRPSVGTPCPKSSRSTPIRRASSGGRSTHLPPQCSTPRVSRRGASAPPSGGWSGARSEGVATSLAGADAGHLLHGQDPDLAVPDLAGGGGADDGIHDLTDHRVVDQDLDPQLRHEVDRVLGTPVDLGVAPLPAEPLGLGQGHPLHARGGEGLFDLVELERLDDGHDQLHCAPPAPEEPPAGGRGGGGAGDPDPRPARAKAPAPGPPPPTRSASGSSGKASSSWMARSPTSRISSL